MYDISSLVTCVYARINTSQKIINFYCLRILLNDNLLKYSSTRLRRACFENLFNCAVYDFLLKNNKNRTELSSVDKITNAAMNMYVLKRFNKFTTRK